MSVSISSNLVEEPIFLCNSGPHHLIASFIGALENLASQSKAKMKNFFLDIDTTIEIEQGGILEKLNQSQIRREQRRFDMSRDDCENDNCVSTEFIQIQKIIYLNSGTRWNVIARFYLSLVSTVKNMISI